MRMPLRDRWGLVDDTSARGVLRLWDTGRRTSERKQVLEVNVIEMTTNRRYDHAASPDRGNRAPGTGHAVSCPA